MGALIVAFLAAVAVATTVEIATDLLFGQVTIWQWNATSVVFFGIVLTLAVYIALRRRSELFEQANAQLAECRRAEAEKVSLAAAIEQTADGVLITDTKARIQYVNPAFTKMTGYRAEEVIGQNPRLLRSGKQDLKFYQGLWDTILAGRVWHDELINRRKDGTFYTEEMSITPVRDSRGVITNFIAIKQDVTERQRAEEANRFLASIAEASYDAIIGTNPEGTVASWNHGAEALYGYRAEEIVGRSISIIVPAERAEELRQILGEIKRGRRVAHFETVRLTKDGRPINVSVTLSPIQDDQGRVTGAAAVVHDITARKKTEEALRRSEAYLAESQRLSHTGSWAWNVAGKEIVFWSPELYRMFGVDPATGPVSFPMFLERIHPEDRPAFDRALERTVREKSDFESGFRIVLPDGSIKHIHSIGHAVLNEAGEFVELMGVGMDVTERQRAQEEMLKAKEAAESASRAKSEFLANMSHEIRTPMNGIIGMTELVLDTELNPEQRENLDLVKTSADSLLNIINDILDFSKIEAKRLKLEHVDFNLRSSVNSTLKTLAVRAEQKKLELAHYLDPGVPVMVQGDPGRLRQVLTNLVGNAIKFTEQGEVVVRVEKRSEGAGEVTLHFSVRDTGIGISPEKRRAIFEPFVQADASTTRRFGGTGLGLTIASQLVEMMGGRIWVESELGQGSTFHFTVRLGAVEALAGEPVRGDAATLRGLPVLVVDDNATNRRILEQTLSRWGMVPALMASGQKALAGLREAREAGKAFPLVIVDAHMEDMDGFTLGKQIKQDPLLANTVLVMLTSSGQRGDGSRCRRIGISAYLTKPVSEAELLDTVQRVLVPRESAKEQPPLVTRHTLREERRRLRILIADDNPVGQRLAVRLVEKQGHSAVAVVSGREVLAALEKEEFDLVLMDVQMPDMDGFEATAAIRRKESGNGAHLPIIALTAHAMQGDREQCLDAGMDGYVTKPVGVKELVAAIESALPAGDRGETTA